MKRAVSHEHIRETNQILILSSVRRAHKITRAALSQGLHLSAPSVSSNIEKLMQMGLLITSGTETTQPDKMGRKGTLVELNPQYAYVLCADLSSKQLRVAVCDMQERLLAEREMEVIENENAEAIQEKIGQAFDKLLAQNGIPVDKVGIIVICSPGVVDSNSGQACYAPQFEGWDRINLKTYFADRFHTQVTVQNDVNTMALGELEYGVGRQFDSFVHISIDLGIGAGVVLDGKLWEGRHFAAGEVGNMLTEPGQLHQKPNQGYLETHLSIPNFLSGVAKELGVKTMDAETLNHLYAQGNPCVVRCAAAMAEQLAMTIANIANLLDVPVISLGGRVTMLRIGLLESLETLLAKLVPFPPAVIISELGSHGAIKGAFSLGVESLLQRVVENVQ